jgi:hypothetical protein
MVRSALKFPLLLAAAFMLQAPAKAGDFGHDGTIVAYDGFHKGRYTPTKYRWYQGNHPWKGWKYPSTYPWATTVTYNAGPGNYYPAHRARMKQERRRQHWTGYPPRHLYVTDYNGYAPQYGFYPD